ncbi:MAG: glycosyltransferase [Halioglobus sp.]
MSKNVVVLGMHRSGTSMVAGALVKAGLYAGQSSDLLVDQDDNPHGFWERNDVVELNEALLESASGAWFSPVVSGENLGGKTDQIHHILTQLDSQSPWLVKDPRMLVTWPAWQAALADAIPVYVYRSPAAVAHSLFKRNRFPLQLGLALWEYYNRAAIGIIGAREHVAVSFERFAASPDSEAALLVSRLIELGVALTAAPTSVFDDTLGQSGKLLDEQFALLMTPSQLALASYCEALCAGEPPGPIPVEDETLAPRLKDLSSLVEPLSDATETRVRLDERTLERDSLIKQLAVVESEHVSLTKAHKKEKKTHKALEKVYHSLSDEHTSLAHAHKDEVARHKEVQKKAEYLFEVSTGTFHKLLAFENSSLGSLSRGLRRFYRLVTLQRGKSTSYEDALEDAHVHFEEFEQEKPERPPNKLNLAGDVVRYVFENPAGSVRSFSMARLKRASSVFLNSNSDDLKVWIDSRFPDADADGTVFDPASLDESLDSLELVFPAVEQPQVSIIVPVYNDYRVTVNCLKALLENTSDVTYEVIIADDCSTDLTQSIEQRVHNIVVVRGEENLRFLRNCNSAAASARGENLLFLNNDTAVCEGWLTSMMEVLERDPSVGVVGPKLLFADGKLQEAGGIMWNDGSAWNFGRADDPDKPQYNYLKEVDYVSGACLLVRAALWQEMGGFDERYVPAYYEDADLAFMAREKGYKVVYQPAAKVFHFEGVSNGTDVTSGVKQYQVANQETFRLKWQELLEADHFANAEQVFYARDRSRHKRTVLFIDHYVPHYDKDAGSRSTMQYVQLMLDMGYRVQFMGANFFPHKPYTAMLQQMGVEVLVGEYMARNLDKWLRENASHIDNIYLHRPHVAEQFLDSLERMNPKPKIVFFGHDLHYLRVQREFALKGGAELEKAAQQWQRREFAVFDQVDTVYYPSEVEVAQIAQVRPELDVKAIPLYALPPMEIREYLPEQRAGILFVGGFNHPPNVDAVSWFVEQVMPLVAAQNPSVVLHVVGSNPTDAVTELQQQNVKVYGYLSDEELDALYRKVQLAVVPLRYGAGVKGKVIEAIQQHVPLLTTAVGAEGIPDADAVMEICEFPQEFADKVLAIAAGDSALLSKLPAYQSWLDSHFSASRAAQIIEQDFGSPLRDG